MCWPSPPRSPSRGGHRVSSGPKLSGTDVWRQWRFQWKPTGGKHEIAVRAVDGDGTVQPEEFRSAYPNGPAGWVSRTIET
ncbi:hypothetical protein [Haladaptatus sp. CMAA 1911]|uniref:hypothetical protein n=1 Tax=unclassified Haladaptatus TaxID=2622732 RepID=UPI0037550A5A